MSEHFLWQYSRRERQIKGFNKGTQSLCTTVQVRYTFLIYHPFTLHVYRSLRGCALRRKNAGQSGVLPTRGADAYHMSFSVDFGGARLQLLSVEQSVVYCGLNCFPSFTVMVLKYNLAVLTLETDVFVPCPRPRTLFIHVTYPLLTYVCMRTMITIILDSSGERQLVKC